jgi:hypothetical protein
VLSLPETVQIIRSSKLTSYAIFLLSKLLVVIKTILKIAISCAKRILYILFTGGPYGGGGSISMYDFTYDENPKK